MTSKQTIIFLLFNFVAGLSYSQEISSEQSYNNSIGITIFQERITAPFEKDISQKSNMGYSISYDIEKSHKRFYINHQFQLSHFKHDGLFRATILQYRPNVQTRIFKSFLIRVPIGLGYGISSSTEKGFVLENGQYKESGTKLKSHFVPSIGLELGYDLSSISIPLKFQISYEYFSLFPYATNSSIPFTLHGSLNLGINIIL